MNEPNLPKPPDGLPPGVPTFEELWAQYEQQNPQPRPEASDITRTVMESAQAAGVPAGAVGGAGPRKDNTAEWERVFPGVEKPQEAERLIRDIREIVRDIQKSIEQLPQGIAQYQR